VPVDEQLRFALPDSLQPGPCSVGPVPQSLELVHGPSVKMLIDTLCKEDQLGAVEGSVIVDPTSYLGVDVLSEAR
jgi:hypothetical protein